MPTIRISYSPDLTQVGDVREVDADEAAVLVADGRAVLVEDPSVLTEKSKDELLAQAAEVGATVSERDSKATIVEAIRGAEAGES
jgi:hypothetical protein